MERKQMPQIPIDEASSRLPQLIHQAREGEEILLTDNGLPVARLTALAQPHQHPRRGSAKGLILHMAPDFDAPLEDFKSYS